MDNPKRYRSTSDFTSSGNDTSSLLNLNVPQHTIPVGGETLYQTTVSVPSKYFGRQLRAQLTTSLPGSKNVPYTYAVCVLNTIVPAGSAVYSFIDISRISPENVRLRVRVINNVFPPQTITVPAFTATARVRTVVVD